MRCLYLCLTLEHCGNMDIPHPVLSTYIKNLHFVSTTIYVVLCVIHQCSTYPTGAPLLACQSMTPQHPPTTTSGSPPFAINLTESVYKPGSEIKGTIYSPSGVKFRGFLIQARKFDNSSTAPLGEFIVTNTDIMHTNCGDGNKQGLTHTTNSNKTSIDFIWKAPSNSEGDIYFKMTIVESYSVSRFWKGILSSVVEDCSLHPSSDCGEMTTEKPGTTPVITSPPAPGKKIQNNPACGKTRGCFPDCTSGCDYLVTWQYDTNSEVVNYDFQMLVDGTENIWVAIGLSPTGKMDETNVIACLSEGSGVTLESSHNEGYSNVYYTSKTMGLSNMQGRAENGKVSCSFSRRKEMNVSDFINLDDETYLLVGTGPVSNGIKHQHQKIPVRSSDKVNFLSNTVSKEADSATPLIKLHGSLMIVAWILLSSIGVVIARHFKSMMKGKMMCGIRYWFAIHRTLMFVVLLCVVVAFIAIFYEIGGFSKISAEPGKEYTKAHPYLGIIVTGLTLLNPIMALFRPSLDHRNRPIFNWAHFSVGTVAHIISVVTIFIGINLSKAKVDTYATYVMIVYSVIFVLVQTILEVHRKRRDPGNTYGKLNSSGEKQHIISDEESSKFQNAVLFLHVIFMLLAATLLVLMICIPTHFHTTK